MRRARSALLLVLLVLLVLLALPLLLLLFLCNDTCVSQALGVLCESGGYGVAGAHLLLLDSFLRPRLESFLRPFDVKRRHATLACWQATDHPPLGCSSAVRASGRPRASATGRPSTPSTSRAACCRAPPCRSGQILAQGNYIDYPVYSLLYR